MRILSAALLILLVSSFAWTQPYGNEWINYNQQYFKIPIVEKGVYRISYQALVNAGFPVQTVQSQQIQLFGKEREVALYIEDGGDNAVNPGDYIEFFAEGNDGWIDSLLYDEPEHIGNPGYSLYNDTLYYFLTWKTSGQGKRFLVENDINYSLYTPVPYVLQKSSKSYSSQYYGGYSQSLSYSSFFSAGEGWGGPNYNGASNFTLPIPLETESIYTGQNAPDVVFHAKSNGNSNASFTGQGNHHLRWTLGTGNYLLHDEVFIGFRQIVVNTTFSANMLSNGNTIVNFNIVGDQGALTDYQSVSYLSLIYPRTTSTNATFIDWLVPKSTSYAKSRVDIEGSGMSQPIAYVFGGGGVPKKIPFTNNSGAWSGLIPNVSGETQRLIVVDQNEVKSVSNITPVNGNGMFTDYSQLNAENAYIILYNKVMMNSVNNYKAYRQSSNGGGHNVLTLEIGDLWMQYGGGVPKHIIGVSRGLNHLYNLSTQKPQALLIAGKGISEANDPNTSGAGSPRKNATIAAYNLVPSYGNPSSDMCITSKWNNSTSYTPAIPTGRIAAKNDAELMGYLDKVRVFEAAQNQNGIYNKEEKEWQKQIIHFGGGQTSSEQALLQSYLNGMKSTIENANYGGNVHSFFKETSDPFNPVQTQEVNDLLENGVSIITFFGHASADGFDQNIDAPENWGNAGKYPLVIGNGCYTGDMFKTDFHSTSENFVLVNDLGAIGFLSATKLGYASYLNMYSAEFYRQVSQENYGETVGRQIIETIRNLELYNSSFLVEVMAMQFAYHGDPGIQLNWHEKPEIDITIEDVFFGPEDISLSTDSISVTTVLTNLGRSITDTFTVTITRTFPNSTIDSVYHISVPGLHYKDTLVLNLPLQPSIGSGVNTFTILADIPSFIPEQYDEYNNNQVVSSFFINIDGIVPVWPYNYAVVPRDSIVLKASTINPLADFNRYRFEIDTTDLFNSPFKKYKIVQGLGGVKEVHPNEWLNASSNMPSPLVLEDSVSYFWRVAVDSSTLLWREHSFQYIPNKRGWGQAHFFQFKNGGFTGIEYHRPSRERKFEPQNIDVYAQVYDNANVDFKYNGTLWRLNGIEGEYGICTTTPSLHVAVVDPLTLEPWGTAFNGVNANHNFGNANNESGCRNRVDKFFIFRQNNSTQLQSFQNMIENEIPDGHIVLVYTAMRATYSSWHPELFTTFQDIGATGINESAPERAFILVYKKGDPSSAQIVHATEPGEFIQMSKPFTEAIGRGVETSTIIGPSLNWKTVYWKQNSIDPVLSDSTRLIIRGMNHNKQVQVEIDTVFTGLDSIPNFNALLPAQLYPYLQLRAEYYDYDEGTPAQVQRWHVLYDDVPEAAIDGTNGYVFLPKSIDSLQEGTEVSLAIDVRNISDLPMDSLLIHYWVTDKNQTKHLLPYERQDSLRVNETLRDTITFNTKGLSGSNVLWMEVNPYTKGFNNELKDQPELAHFNNILQIPFTLKEDELNPILDVTFDGEHILNGDIVNPNAEILISLKDENPFLVMNEDADTSNFGIYITYPSGEQKRIPFIDGAGNQVLNWIPANESNLRFTIIYNAEFEESGTYVLMVQGSDKAGNLSGDLAYKVSFDVVLESSITYLMNYPNPFSTSTRFVFTLTGSEVPDDMVIQIMTVTGRIVREITEDELGPIRIGRNITEYAWDGRDEFGDQLANGVYLYRVKARINGEDIEHRTSGADKFFKRNWGKMYLMR